MQLPVELKDIKLSLKHYSVAKCKIILTRNKANRPINKENITFISSAMKRDKWMFTGETIIFSKNGDLMNGQHRLESVIITGKEQWFATVENVDNKAFSCMDINKPRSSGDALSIENIINPQSYAAIGKFIILYNRGGFSKMATRSSNKALLLTPGDISDFVLKRHPSLTKSREYGYAKENVLIPGNLYSAMHYIFKQIDNDAACDFCNKLSDGKELEKNDPIFILREELKAEKRSQRKMEQDEKIGLISKAWNLYRQGKKINALKFDTTKDEFPKPI